MYTEGEIGKSVFRLITDVFIILCSKRFKSYQFKRKCCEISLGAGFLDLCKSLMHLLGMGYNFGWKGTFISKK